jgi:hypothetical protein
MPVKAQSAIPMMSKVWVRSAMKVVPEPLNGCNIMLLERSVSPVRQLEQITQVATYLPARELAAGPPAAEASISIDAGLINA